MNKETFLEELRRCLQILEDQEQEDILEEYAQHIDIKIQKGLSEEEAIRDFGSVKELAAEILEAYHVKPEYQGQKGANRLPKLSRAGAEEGKRLFQKMRGFLKEKSSACMQGLRRGFRWTGKKCRACGSWIRGLFFRNRQTEPSEEGRRSEEGMIAEQMNIQGEEGAPVISPGFRREGLKNGQQKDTVHKHGFWKGLGHGIVVCQKACVRICLWWLRLFWNLAWLLFSVFCGILAAMMLAGVGGTVVLLFQGYPLIGVLLLSLGGLLCFGALSCGAYSLMIRREKKESAEAEPEKTEPEETDSEAEGMNLEETEDAEKESREEVRHE